MSYVAKRDANRPPVHPGAILREDVLPALDISVTEAAKHLRITRQTLHRILAETSAITPEMALRIGKFVGNCPQLWLSLQETYDLWHGERKLAAELSKIKTAKAA